MKTYVLKALLSAAGLAAMLAAGSVAWGGAESYGDYSDMGSSMMHEGARVNLNSATVEDFVAVPGISYEQAQAIVDYRDANGPFTDVDQLLNVKGIDSDSLETFRDRLTVW